MNNIDIFSLPEPLGSLPVETLPLDNRLHSKFISAGVINVKGVVSKLKNGVKLLNSAQKERAMVIVNALAETAVDDEPNWYRFCEKLSFPILTLGMGPSSNSERLASLARLFEEIFKRNKDERKWKILQYRFGFNGKKIMTLDDLGKALGNLTRERIRQLEENVLKELKDILLENNYVGKDYRVDEYSARLTKEIKDVVFASGEPFAIENKLISNISAEISVLAERQLPVIHVLFELFGLKEIKDVPHGTPVIWKIDPKYSGKRLLKLITRLYNLFTSDYVPSMDEIEIMAKLNRYLNNDTPLSKYEFQGLLDLADYLEQDNQGRYQAKIECIQSRMGQIERLLHEAGKPVNIKELTRQLNKKLVSFGQKAVTVENIGNQISADKRFVAIGSTGMRALRRWDLPTETIVEQMENALNLFGRPATAEEIYDHVKSKRHVSFNSVKIYLKNEKFKSQGYSKWGLASWPDDSKAKDPIADFVIAEFERLGISEMPYPQIVKAVATKFETDINSARGILRHHSILKSRRREKGGATTAILNRNFRASAKIRKPRQRKTETLFERSSTFVCELLSGNSSGLALSFLNSKLQKHLEMNKQTAYQYISKMEFIEKVSEQDQIICKLKKEAEYSISCLPMP